MPVPVEDGESSNSAPHTRRRDSPLSSEELGQNESDVGGEDRGDANQDQQVKKMVRLALACEYRRSEIKRAEISEKVLSSTNRRGNFNKVFDEAQLQLRHVFGMEMTELPAKEKVTLAQRRAAQKSSASSTKSWILTSTLPAEYRAPAILTPSKVPTASQESSYTALYTFIISVISLSGGTLPHNKLERYLRRANADESTPVASTEKLLQRLVKDGYIIKIKDTSSGEELVDYVVGPRGKVEVGEEGVKGLVEDVYGGQANEELARKIERSLAVGRREEERDKGNGGGGGEEQKKRSRKRRDERGIEEQEEDEESD
ncbi:MAG: Altered inheritance of mitochondria protein 18 mitochondrial [Bogoriella megaspora]|nr:MAG: Altered inheritance of mitochondria protein 18 mitochondrial [Bogoriella megaspora]